jgi:hypothetical protein
LEFGHYFGEAAARASTAATLRNFQNIEQGLRSNALDAIVTNFAA